MAILKRANQTNFTVVSNDIINHPALSLEAKMVLIYLLSKPAHWAVKFADVQNYGKFGRDKRQKIFQELETCGYFERTEIRTGGKIDYDYLVHEQPLSGVLAPLPENQLPAVQPLPVQPLPIKPPHSKYRDLVSIELEKKLKNTQTACAPETGSETFSSLSEPETQSEVELVLDGLRTRLKLVVLPNEAEWFRWAIWAETNGFTAANFLDCYDRLKSQTWRTGRLAAHTVAENLPDFVAEKIGSGAAENPTAQIVKPATENESQLAENCIVWLKTQMPLIADQLQEQSAAIRMFRAGFSPQDMKLCFWHLRDEIEKGKFLTQLGFQAVEKNIATWKAVNPHARIVKNYNPTGVVV